MNEPPHGVKILGIILIVTGVLSIIGGILIQTPLLGIVFYFVDNLSKTYFYNFVDFTVIHISISPFLLIYSVLSFIGGGFLFVLTVGLLKLQKWAYKASVIISIPSIAIIIGIFMIWFLLQDDVKDAFES